MAVEIGAPKKEKSSSFSFFLSFFLSRFAELVSIGGDFDLIRSRKRQPSINRAVVLQFDFFCASISTNGNEFYWVLLGFNRDLLFFFPVLHDFVGFDTFLLVFNGFHLVAMGFTGFYWVLLFFPSITRFCWL